ncbi:importin alpha re-exporter [Dacryopinax primogenitus]|uniref:Importin alpha re-exporter n=1 Tax=Dacryopinax primogenitus (strain DJM 731) TaxID=1858805 RepID=M5G0D0_DACPD|nr:importin alpha re-exporter [Dacryopinax primogenitus]EJU01600.1 importin alpha re-exporter [Dacryopinax primogenitus]
MQTFVNALNTSLIPGPDRRGAEAWLQSATAQPGMLPLALTVIQNVSLPSTTRQLAAVWVKNTCKAIWGGESEDPVPPDADVVALKGQLVPLTVSLGSQSSHQALLAEAVSIIAAVEFPQTWPDLMDQLVACLSPTDWAANAGVMEIAHSVFLPWRSMTRSDELFLAIKTALDKFCPPYMAVFTQVDAHLEQPSSSVPVPLLGKTLHSMLQIYLDLNSQDLPEFFEDNMGYFMGNDGRGGVLLKYLAFERPELKSDDEDTPGLLQKIPSTICEIAELYAMKYHEEFKELRTFVGAVWELLGKLNKDARNDMLVNQALHFLGVVVKMGIHREFFDNADILRGFCERIILPNIILQEKEEDMFEDDPLEYIRRDLETATDATTRRQSATEFTRAVMEHFEGPITTMLMPYINQNLEQYRANPSENWKYKDTAICLLTAIGSRGGTAHQGVTSTNAMVDVVPWFGQNVLVDLQAPPDTVHPIIQVDGIKFLHTFRNQLTKEQLVTVLPLVVHHLSSSNYVASSYAAIAIERILFIKKSGQFMFGPTDMHDLTLPILQTILQKIISGQTPDKVAENDYLMKCVMRVILTARQTLVPIYADILNSLVTIIGIICANPSNPMFSQYCFESLSALVRFITAAQPVTVSQFETALFPVITGIMQQEAAADFIPYAFQILSQLLEAHTGDLPPAYNDVLRNIVLSPQQWQAKGSIPALVRLLKAFLQAAGRNMEASGALKLVFGLLQQRLFPSKLYDGFGFEILQTIIVTVPPEHFQPYISSTLMTILHRLMGQRSANLYYYWMYFVAYASAVQVEGFSPDFIITTLNTIQAGIMAPLLKSVITPELPRTQVKHRKVVVVGYTRLLTQCPLLLQEPNVEAWPTTLEAVLQLFEGSQAVSAEKEEDVADFDVEPGQEMYQASFSKLSASAVKEADPVGYVNDPRVYLSEQLAQLSSAKPGVVKPLMEKVQYSVRNQFMATNGHSI